jgi:hypothetical protein
MREILEFLEDRDGGASDGEILRAMRERHGKQVTRRQITSRLGTLHKTGRVGAGNRVIQPRLLPALLLLQVSDDNEDAVVAAVRSEVPKAESVAVTPLFLQCNLLMRASVLDIKSVDVLCRLARGAGAAAAMGLLEQPPVAPAV